MSLAPNAQRRRPALVAIDMGEAYKTVVKERAINANIVCERFHIVMLLLDAVVAVSPSRTQAGE